MNHNLLKANKVKIMSSPTIVLHISYSPKASGSVVELVIKLII